MIQGRTGWLLAMALCMSACAAPPPVETVPCSQRLSDFAQNIWLPVVAPHCYGWHRSDGVAAMLGSGLHFVDENTPDALMLNYEALRSYAAASPSTLLRKPSGGLHHFGGAPLTVGDASYRALQQFVGGARKAASVQSCAFPVTAQPVLETGDSLRRASLILAARPPTPNELAEARTPDGLHRVLRGMIGETAFAERLMEAYNEQLLTDALREGGAGFKAALASNPNALWFGGQNDWPSQSIQRSAIDSTNDAIAREPLQLIAYVVQHDLPFDTVLTAPYTVVNPFTACAYGVEDKVKFAQPVHCRASEAAHYDPWDLQPIPLHGHHAGVLTTASFLNRHSNTKTNRDRNRANTVTTAFLGTDMLRQSFVSVTPAHLKSVNPPLTVAQCAVCHRMLDPTSGAFQNWDEAGRYTQQVWYADQLPPAFGKTALPVEQTPEALRWLAKQVVADPRFARQAVNVAYTMLMGSPPAEMPPLGGADWQAAFAAWMVQSQQIDSWARDFRAGGMHFADLVEWIVTSPAFRMADSDDSGAMGGPAHPLLTPALLDRRIDATLHIPWTDATGAHVLTHGLFYYDGGIDSNAITRRASRPTGAIAAVRLRMADELACAVVPRAFSGDKSPEAQAARRDLFPEVTLEDTPLHRPEAIRRNLVHLHARLLGQEVATDDPQIDEAWEVFRLTYEALQQGDAALPAPCRVVRSLDGRPLPAPAQLTNDRNRTVQAWMATVSYLLADWRFITE